MYQIVFSSVLTGKTLVHTDSRLPKQCYLLIFLILMPVCRLVASIAALDIWATITANTVLLHLHTHTYIFLPLLYPFIIISYIATSKKGANKSSLYLCNDNTEVLFCAILVYSLSEFSPTRILRFCNIRDYCKIKQYSLIFRGTCILFFF